MNPLEPVTVLLPAAGALVGALLTYLATRRGHEVNERSVYLGAVGQVTAMLRDELARSQEARAALAAQVAELEARLARRDAEDRRPPAVPPSAGRSGVADVEGAPSRRRLPGS